MIALLRHEWRQIQAGGSPLALSLVFLFAVISVLAFGIGADLPLLARTGPGILWVATLLATLIGTERLIAEDTQDGTLDTLRVNGLDLTRYAVAKIITRWLFTVLPLAAVSPLGGLLLAMSPQTIFATAATLLFGSIALACLSTLAAALTAGARGSAMLGPILVVPLLVPVVIFGAAAASSWPDGGYVTPILLLGATSLVSVAIVPISISAILSARD